VQQSQRSKNQEKVNGILTSGVILELCIIKNDLHRTYMLLNQAAAFHGRVPS